MTLTAAQITQVRFDLADIASAITEDEINDAFDRTGDLTSTAQRLHATAGICLRNILMDAARLHDYAAGQTTMNEEAVFKHYLTLYQVLYQSAVESLLGGTPALSVGFLRSTQHPTRSAPTDAS